MCFLGLFREVALEMKNTTLEVHNLTKTFKKKLVVDRFSLCLQEGDVWGMVGDNGSGKTTVFRMMVGLITMDYGSVAIMGYNILDQYQEAITKVGVIFDHQSYYENFTALQNMKLVSNLCNGAGYSPEEILNMVGLDIKDKTKVKKYSTGMRKRLGLAIALISKPKVVLMDEPTNGLDPSGIRDLYSIIQNSSKQEGVSFLITSHNICDIELICNGVLILKDGKIISNHLIKNMKEAKSQSLEEIYFQLIHSEETVEA